jgi:hypothetical protein
MTSDHLVETSSFGNIFVFRRYPLGGIARLDYGWLARASHVPNPIGHSWAGNAIYRRTNDQ